MVEAEQQRQRIGEGVVDTIAPVQIDLAAVHADVGNGAAAVTCFAAPPALARKHDPDVSTAPDASARMQELKPGSGA